ncbi:PspC domain-containing protein [Gracilibacillus xinjiangensis]|uniref:PspC domain-containing protein n=1 Tax=Gracilibacillus xinjiangensis TaxID=1193282 RepID=A0ABV8X0S5_9BACI
MNRNLYRSEHNKMLEGVLGGIAENYNLDPALLRLIYVILFIFTAGLPLFLLYIAATIIIPKRGVE